MSHICERVDRAGNVIERLHFTADKPNEFLVGISDPRACGLAATPPPRVERVAAPTSRPAPAPQPAPAVAASVSAAVQRERRRLSEALQVLNGQGAGVTAFGAAEARDVAELLWATDAPGTEGYASRKDLEFALQHPGDDDIAEAGSFVSLVGGDD